MIVYLSKHITFLLIVVSTISCSHQTNRKKKTKEIISTFQDTSIFTASNKIDSPILKTLNYASWASFWKAYKKATNKKDTERLVQLTYFPFSQNGEMLDKTEFVKYCIAQVYGIEKNGFPVTSNDSFIPGLSNQSDQIPKFDSVYYAHAPHKDFYFAKVNGYYRLVQIITPE